VRIDELFSKHRNRVPPAERKKYRRETVEKIRKILQEHPGASHKKISMLIGVNVTTIDYYFRHWPELGGVKS
jgi:hypothetical protein